MNGIGAVLIDIDGVLTVSWKALPGAVEVLETAGDGTDDGAAPDVVVFGGAGEEFGYRALNGAFRHLQRGARLIAMHRNLYWRTASGLDLDTGAFLLGLERAARVEAVVTGKPAATFFATAL